MLTRLLPPSLRTSPYVVNLLVFVPRHWFIYLVAFLFPALIFINIDGGPRADDSGHYFNFWFAGLICVAFAMALVAADVMRKPMYFCLPRQKVVLQRLLFGLGLVVSLIFYLVAVLPEHAYWVPSLPLGKATMILIGWMLFLLCAGLTLRFPAPMGWVVLLLLFGTTLVVRVYFRGTGPDIVRPPDAIFTWMTWASLAVIPLAWVFLQNHRPRFLAQDKALITGDIRAQLEQNQLFWPGLDSPNRVGHASDSQMGSWLLKQLSLAPVASKKRVLWGLLYRIAGGNSGLRVAAVWLGYVVIAAYFAFALRKEFEPLVLLYMVTLLVCWQGPMMFRGNRAALVVPDRRALFMERMLDVAMRLVLLCLIYGFLFLAAFGVVRYGPQWGWTPAFTALRDLPLAAYGYCLFMAPLVLVLFHRSRSLGWFLVLALVSSLTMYHASALAQAFGRLPWALAMVLCLLAWGPFIILNYLRSFKGDLI